MEIQVFNSMDYEEFVDKFGNVIEKCPLIAATVWTNRPFTNLAALEKAFGDFIDLLPSPGKEGLLRCHPDLAGRDLLRGTLSTESQAQVEETTIVNGSVMVLNEIRSEQVRQFKAGYSSNMWTINYSRKVHHHQH
ncbi:2-oxo-4-hydroxy-4-carboxy-5-ureidoimidazoline decarboxylase isoform X2 [Mobula birostris]|uniref:2-oxo-4-hydroxy-4-carboxy-5-ureidoimidazoline decarboxylase isoform X2 n=1 Tax=Mobula birostris TaxID=1983395 RepID=UPI003B282E40